MKISVRNLGIIQDEAHIDLKPLTIFIGPNNSGKTWLAYTLASIFGPVANRAYLANQNTEQLLQIYSPITQAIDKVLTTGASTLDIKHFAENFTELYFNELAANTSEWLPEYLGTQLATFDNFTLSIKLADDKTQYIQNIIRADWQMNIGLVGSDSTNNVNNPDALFNARKKTGETEIYMYTSSEGVQQKILPREIIEENLTRYLLQTLHEALYLNVIVLPTERTTFITFPFNALDDQVFKKKNVFAEGITQNLQNIRTLPSPVINYVQAAIRTSRLSAREKTRREKSRNPTVKEFIRLAKILEETILAGKVDFSQPEPDPTREIYFQPDQGTTPLEITAASSMVKELAPLVFYLRYFARRGELLVIDEPEMNLHPRAQAQMIEFLAMLVNAGLHVLITTHSPYMIDHLNNLFIAYEHNDKKSIRSLFFLQNTQAFIKKNKTAVYLIDQGKIRNMLEGNEEEGENQDTFGNISDQISDIYFQL